LGVWTVTTTWSFHEKTGACSPITLNKKAEQNPKSI
jgi:hypothetical protein